MNVSIKTMEERRSALLKSAKRIVLKVGSGVLTDERYTSVDEEVIKQVASQVACLVKMGKRVVVVSSGSIVIGSQILGLPRRGLSIPEKQASAALGQGDLISIWSRFLAEEGVKTGQILLTHDDLSNRRRFLNARNTINTLLDFGVIPIINENDTVAVHEIKFGDNDTLSARVTNLLEADLLAILSDVDGLYTADPRLDKTARKIEFIEDVDDKIFAMAGDSSSKTGMGGMTSKIRAACEAARFGTPTIILPGATKMVLLDAIEGGAAGSFFFPHSDRLQSKKHWIVFHLKSRGTIMVDDGARRAITQNGKSLLPSGVVAVDGTFESGEAVYLAGEDMAPFAKGVVKYHAHELEKIKGKKTDQIEDVLGYKPSDEIVHRDDMVLIGGSENFLSYEDISPAWETVKKDNDA